VLAETARIATALAVVNKDFIDVPPSAITWLARESITVLTVGAMLLLLNRATAIGDAGEAQVPAITADVAAVGSVA
jgi:hypothetical protein